MKKYNITYDAETKLKSKAKNRINKDFIITIHQKIKNLGLDKSKLKFLVVDAVTANTTKHLIKIGIKEYQIYIVNFDKNDCQTIQQSHPYVHIFCGTLNTFLEQTNIQFFGIWLDAVNTYVSQQYYIHNVFDKQLLSHNGILMLTCCMRNNHNYTMLEELYDLEKYLKYTSYNLKRIKLYDNKFIGNNVWTILYTSSYKNDSCEIFDYDQKEFYDQCYSGNMSPTEILMICKKKYEKSNKFFNKEETIKKFNFKQKKRVLLANTNKKFIPNKIKSFIKIIY
jgi:hypothetical protein